MPNLLCSPLNQVEMTVVAVSTLVISNFYRYGRGAADKAVQPALWYWAQAPSANQGGPRAALLFISA